MDPTDREKYNARVKEWTKKHDEYLKEHPYLRKNPKRLAPGYTGNGKPSESKMSRQNPNPPSLAKRTKPSDITDDDREDIVRYAIEKGINVIGIKKFDGDVELLKEQIDALSSFKDEYPDVFTKGKPVSIAFSDRIENGTFAVTNNKTITFNKFYLRSREHIMAELSDHYYSCSTANGIAKHEFGHILENVYHPRYGRLSIGRDFARKAYYNIYNKYLDDEALRSQLIELVSDYCVPKVQDMFGNEFVSWNEVTSEMLACDNPSELVLEFIRLWKEDISR